MVQSSCNPEGPRPVAESRKYRSGCVGSFSFDEFSVTGGRSTASRLVKEGKGWKEGRGVKKAHNGFSESQLEGMRKTVLLQPILVSFFLRGK